MRWMCLLILPVIGFSSVSTTANATTIQDINGSVSVNSGSGYNAVGAQTNVSTGDTVTVGPGGSATIVYADGCRVTVAEGQVVAVQELSPCVSPQGIDTTTAVVGVAVVGAAVGIGFAVAGDSDKSSASP